MKILQLSAYADPIGGAEIYRDGLTEELERRGHTVARFGTSPDRELDEPLDRVVRRGTFDPTRLVRDDAVTDALATLLDRFDPDLVHVHNLYSLALSVDRLLAASGRPVVQTVHDYSVVCPNAWCTRPDGTLCEGGAGAKCFEHDCGANYPFDAKLVLVTRLRHRLLQGLIRAAICPSRYLADLYGNHGFRNVRHVFNYVDAQKLALEPAERSARELLYLGRLDPEKGIDQLLEAMPRILEAEPETRLTVVGGGLAADSLHEHASRLGLDASVTFHAKVPYEEVKRFYATATLKILPSIWCENSPLTAYECMVAGLPMVGCRIGGIPDLVADGETGALCRPRDPGDLADKVVALLRDPEGRARMSQRMQERAGDFTRERNVDQVEAIYREVLEAGDAGAPEPTAVPDDDFVIYDRLLQDLGARESWALELLEQVKTLEAGGGPWIRLRGAMRKALGRKTWDGK